jgi:hypothetical protein
MAQKQSYTSEIETKNHNIVARTLKNALTLGHFEAWGAFATVAAARLDDRERAALAFAALKTQSPDHAWMTVEAALDDGAGPPLAPFMYITSEAKFWASIASTQERKVYTLAAFNALRPEEQRDFLKFVTKEVAA